MGYAYGYAYGFAYGYADGYAYAGTSAGAPCNPVADRRIGVHTLPGLRLCSETLFFGSDPGALFRGIFFAPTLFPISGLTIPCRGPARK